MQVVDALCDTLENEGYNLFAVVAYLLGNTFHHPGIDGEIAWLFYY